MAPSSHPDSSSLPDSGATVMLVFPQAEIIDIAGPLDILGAGRCYADGDFDPARFRPPVIVSQSGGPITTVPSGIVIHSEPFAAIEHRAIDTLLVAGGYGVRAARREPQLIDWLRRTAARARLIVSICTGALLLAEAGLLAGRRATTHWKALEVLAGDFPDVKVEPDAIFVQDGNVHTSAGITAGMDLALALVEAEHGPEHALAIARQWLLYARRPGGQSQFSALLPERAAERRAIVELQAWIQQHLGEDLTVARLAAWLNMSPRHFARVFQAETGTTPARYVETVRLEAARRRLESGTQSMLSVALECGLGDPERLRRSFLRRLGINPSAYRQRFEQRHPRVPTHPN